MAHERYDGNGNGRHETGNGAANGNGNGEVTQPMRLRALYGEQLADLRAAERQAASILPSLARVASDEDVASLIRSAATETEIQLARLESLIDSLDLPTRDAPESAPDDVVDEARTLLGDGDDGGAADRDEALLRSARKSLRYQIAGYESACATARRLGDYRALDVLLRSLDEELATDSTLSDIVSRRSRLLRSL